VASPRIVRASSEDRISVRASLILENPTAIPASPAKVKALTASDNFFFVSSERLEFWI